MYCPISAMDSKCKVSNLDKYFEIGFKVGRGFQKKSIKKSTKLCRMKEYDITNKKRQ